MKTHFLDVPVSLIREDSEYPDRETRFIYEHLKYLCSRPRLFPLPAIDVRLNERTFVVTRGHSYLRIARELGHPRIRTVLSSDVLDTADVLASLPTGVGVTPREQLESEAATRVARDYHVYFFVAPLASEAQKRFLADIAGFFERLKTPLIGATEKRLFHWAFPFDGYCAEFEALIPVGDTSWYEAYLKTCRTFSRDMQRIVSFQGARFPQ